MGTQKVLRQAQNTGSNSIFGRWSRIGKKQKDNEAKKESTLETADYFNKPELEKKATKQNKGEEHSKSIWRGHEGTGDLNKPTCDLDMGWE